MTSSKLRAAPSWPGIRILRKGGVAEIPSALIIVCLVIIAASPQVQAATLTTLYSFTGFPDGNGPFSNLIMDPAGNLYGTSTGGGSFNNGTVFKLDPTGHEAVLYNFGGYTSDGTVPYAGLVRDAAGNFYSTTATGGTFNEGVVFKLDPTGHETVLYNFGSHPNDARSPQTGLIMDAAGNLYGTSSRGGAFGGVLGFGNVFKVDPSGHETVLYDFGGHPNDGTNPSGVLIMDAAGNLYGIAGGGSFNNGVVFKLDPSGHETVLYNFGGQPHDGDGPSGGLIKDAAGNFYGTTGAGGKGLYAGNGTVFKVDPSGHETVLYNFAGGPTDGKDPFAGVIMDAAGNLYGTTGSGGLGGCCSPKGTVFKLDSSGHETVLYYFGSNLHDGWGPWAGLMMDVAGNLYGTTAYGGVGCCGGNGTVFEIKGAIAPVPEPNALLLLGSGLLGFSAALRRKLRAWKAERRSTR